MPLTRANSTVIESISASQILPGGATAGQVLTYNGTTNTWGPSAAVNVSSASITAWVNFDGTKDTTGATSTANTNRLIRASSNVSSVSRNSAGDYTINFSNILANSNYCINFTVGTDTTSTSTMYRHIEAPFGQAPTSSSVRVRVSDSAGTAVDNIYCSVSVIL